MLTAAIGTTTARGQLAVPSTAPAVPSVAGPLALVSVVQGTDSDAQFSHGNTLPLVGAPWGMTDWSIQNHGGAGEHWFYASKYHSFAGFRATHQASPWVADYGQFLVAPQTGPAALGAEDRACDYDPAATVQRPDYARVRLDRYHVQAELTATERCGVMRLTFDPGQRTGRLIFDVAGAARLAVDGARVEGLSRHHTLPAPGNFACHFVAQLDRPVTASQPIGTADHDGKGTGFVEFDLGDRPVVEVRFATSYLGPEQAWQNLKAETAGGFEATRQRTAAAWSDKLGRLTVEGGTADDRATFYSCLYRALKFPHRFHEVTADGRTVHFSPFDGQVHDGVSYTDSGLWDTYRTEYPFLSIAYPDQLGQIVAGWLNDYREGGALPQWPNPGGVRGVMIGSHADAMVADAMAKGIAGFDHATAYQAVHHDAFDVRGPGVREHMATYLKLGYMPAKDGGYWVSTSLDLAYDDWCVAQVAKLTGHDADCRELMRRAQNYRKLWDPSVGFMRAKDAAGRFVPRFDEFAWGGGYAECGPWQGSWAVQHDARGLAELAGGPAAFAKVLDRLFDQPPTIHPGAYGGTIHEMSEMVACRMGQYGGSNQPSFHIPYLYAAVGQPWKTEYWTRKACRQLFNAGVDGYCGDEDNGSNASWYLLSAMGLYPLTPGHPTYVLTSPVFASVRIDPPNGRPFTVTAVDNSPDHVYVRSRTLNGRPVTRTWISHEQITAGGTLTARMGSRPDERTVAADDLPYSASSDDTAKP